MMPENDLGLGHISWSKPELTKGNETYDTVGLYLLLDMALNLVKRRESRGRT